MKISAPQVTRSLIKKIDMAMAMALPLAMVISAPSVLAQGAFDTGPLNGEGFAVRDTNQPALTPGLAENSNGTTGDVGRQSYKTGESPGFSGLSGNTSNYTNKQLGGGLFKHLTLPYVTTGRLAPIFGMGGSPSSLPKYTTILDDPIMINTGSAGSVGIDPSTGAVFTRQGSTAVSVGGLNSGSFNAGINIGGTNLNLGGIGGPGGINVSGF